MMASVREPRALDETARLRLERDLYLGLLTLNAETELEPFLRDALGLMLRVAGASQGYLEIFSETDGADWWTAAGVSDEQIDGIRAAVSAPRRYRTCSSAIGKGRSPSIRDKVWGSGWRSLTAS